LTVWEARTGARLFSKDFASPFTSVAFHPDGRLMAAGGGDGSVRFLDLATGEERFVWNNHTGGVTCLAYSPDGKRFASGAADKKVWVQNEGQDGFFLPEGLGAVHALSFSPDGSQLATASGDMNVLVWDPVAGQRRAVLGPCDGVVTVAFSPDGRFLAAGLGDGAVVIWDAKVMWDAKKLNKPLRSLKCHAAGVNGLAFTPDSRGLVTGGAVGPTVGEVKLWDPATGEELLCLLGHTAPVTAVAVGRDGRLASASGDKTIKLWDAARVLDALPLDMGPTAWVFGVAFSADGRNVAGGGSDGNVCVWDAHTRQRTRLLKGHSQWVACVAYSRDGRLASGGEDGTVKLWGPDKDQPECTLGGDEKDAKGIAGVAFSPDGGQVAAVTWDDLVRVWDVKTRRETQRFQGSGRWRRQDWIILDGQHVAFSPDGRRLATAEGSEVTVCDVTTGGEVRPLSGLPGRVVCVAYDAAGRRLAGASEDGTIKVWDEATGEATQTLKGHTGRVSGMAFSPSSRRLVSASLDGTVKLWDLATGEEVFSYRRPGPIFSVAFNHDGTLLALGGTDGAVRTWAAPREP
jgi:WD40 repeat protein